MIYADGKRLKQIIFNLLSNALKFSFPGGIIELEINYLYLCPEENIDPNEEEKSLSPSHK